MNDAQRPDPPQDKQSHRRPLDSAVVQGALIWGLLIAGIPLSHFANAAFPSVQFVLNILILGLFLVVVAFGQGLVILSGGFDLSVPTVVAVGAYATGFLSSAGFHPVIATLLALVIATFVGAINGLIVAQTDFPPFIVTLAVSSIIAALMLGFSRTAAPAQRSPEYLSDIFLSSSRFLGIPLPILILAIFVALGVWVQHGSTLGRYAYALGVSQRASRLTRLPVRTATVAVYSCAALAYGFAGVLLLGYSSGTDLNIGAQWLLPSIAAVVMGGSSIKGGQGLFLATVGGALLLTLVDIDVRALGISEGARQIIYGLIILAALIGARVTGKRAV